MKVFEKSKNGRWGNRLNFIDANNVVLGYDYDESCCKNFYYYITKTEPSKFENDCERVETELLNNEDLYFDTSYNKNLEGEDYWNDNYATVFKVLGGETDLFIVLVNCHNGYYCHGFDMVNQKGKIIFDGLL